MPLTAKYSSICPRCGKTIRVGSDIEWVRGSNATHADCSKRTRDRHHLPPVPELGVSERRVSNATGYTLGSVIYRRELDGGGGPDGHYWTVVFKRYYPNEMEWRAHVRPATAAEAGEALVRRIKDEEREAAKRLLRSIQGQIIPYDEFHPNALTCWVNQRRFIRQGDDVLIYDPALNTMYLVSRPGEDVIEAMWLVANG